MHQIHVFLWKDEVGKSIRCMEMSLNFGEYGVKGNVSGRQPRVGVDAVLGAEVRARYKLPIHKYMRRFNLAIFETSYGLCFFMGP